MILCHLSAGGKSVTEPEQIPSWRLAAVSQKLARLRPDGMVSARRDGKTMYYAPSEPRLERLIGTLHDMFCNPDHDG